MVECGAGGSPNPAAEQRELTEKSASPDVTQDQVPTGMRLRHLDETDANEKKAVRRLALTANHLSGSIASQFNAFAQLRDKLRSNRGEHGNVTQLRRQGALAVILVHPGAEGFVALQDIQNVAQHLQHHAIGLGAHGCRAWILVHTSHFAEQVARFQLGDRIAVGQVYGSIDGNVSLSACFMAWLLRLVDKRRLELAQEPVLAAFGGDVAHRTGKKHFRLATEDVVSR